MDPNRKDALMQKFVKNYRKAIDNVTGSPRTVCFNPETLETSFGGTQSPGHIKDSSVIEKQRAALNARNAASSASKSKPQMSLSKVTQSQEKPRTPQAKTSSDVGRTPVSVRKSEAVNSENVFVTPNKIPISSHRNQKDDGFRTPADKKTDLFRKSVSQTPDCFNSVTIGTPLNKTRARRSEELIQTENCGVTVAVRVRPFSTRELKEDCPPKCIISMYQNETTVVTEKGESHQFAYDHSFWSFDETGGEFASQDKVYQMLAQPILDKAIEGFNTCLFAYGQTGSGKSYSIMGHNEETGIIPRFCDEMFGRISVDRKKAKINVEISYFEIYNEKIHDLLGPTNKDKTGKKTNLKVREHPSLGIYVEGLSSYVVETFDDINGWLNVGNKHRATAATGMNDKSSRSHSVFTIVLTQTKTDTLDGVDHDHTITSKINLIDLAGSERQSLAKTSGERFREGASINTSLMTLGKVISLLSEQSTTNTSKKKKLYIPYRDSVLTWILKETLGGNSKTAMLATISPSSHHTEETLSTLRYAKQARSIMNAARVNEDPKARLIRELRATIERLKSQSGTMGDDGISASMAEIGMLREKLAERDREMMEMTKSWQEKLKKSEERKLEEARLLERSGIAFTVDNTLPNLVNLNEDPQLSEKLLYVLEQGKTRVGRAGGRTDIHIQLTGPLIAEEHCTLEYLRKKVVITPIADALTYVNGNLIGDPTTLCHGDRVILGGDHYFRFGNPTEVVPGQRRSGAPKDFEFAHQELISAQNARNTIHTNMISVVGGKKSKKQTTSIVTRSESMNNMMESPLRKSGFNCQQAWDLDESVPPETSPMPKVSQCSWFADASDIINSDEEIMEEILEEVEADESKQNPESRGKTKKFKKTAIKIIAASKFSKSSRRNMKSGACGEGTETPNDSLPDTLKPTKKSTQKNLLKSAFIKIKAINMFKKHTGKDGDEDLETKKSLNDENDGISTDYGNGQGFNPSCETDVLDFSDTESDNSTSKASVVKSPLITKSTKASPFDDLLASGEDINDQNDKEYNPKNAGLEIFNDPDVHIDHEDFTIEPDVETTSTIVQSENFCAPEDNNVGWNTLKKKPKLGNLKKEKMKLGDLNKEKLKLANLNKETEKSTKMIRSDTELSCNDSNAKTPELSSISDVNSHDLESKCRKGSLTRSGSFASKLKEAFRSKSSKKKNNKTPKIILNDGRSETEMNVTHNASNNSEAFDESSGFDSHMGEGNPTISKQGVEEKPEIPCDPLYADNETDEHIQNSPKSDQTHSELNENIKTNPVHPLQLPAIKRGSKKHKKKKMDKVNKKSSLNNLDCDDQNTIVKSEACSFSKNINGNGSDKNPASINSEHVQNTSNDKDLDEQITQDLEAMDNKEYHQNLSPMNSSKIKPNWSKGSPEPSKTRGLFRKAMIKFKAVQALQENVSTVHKERLSARRNSDARNVQEPNNMKNLEKELKRKLNMNKMLHQSHTFDIDLQTEGHHIGPLLRDNSMFNVSDDFDRNSPSESRGSSQNLESERPQMNSNMKNVSPTRVKNLYKKALFKLSIIRNFTRIANTKPSNVILESEEQSEGDGSKGSLKPPEMESDSFPNISHDTSRSRSLECCHGDDTQEVGVRYQDLQDSGVYHSLCGLHYDKRCSSPSCSCCGRLEAELEEARKKHEEELQQQESEAKARMETELARSKQNAEKQLHAQKNQYEIKLSTLEQQMRDFQKDLQQKQHESDQTRQQAQEAYHRLQRQKLVLEQEVLANRKRLELEEEAALKVQQESRVSHCKIVEQLEKEKQKIQEDVQKWTALRQQREAGGLTPRILTPRTPVMQDSSKKDLYRIMLNVREANKISQLLGQQTVFAREEVANKNELQPLIKVTNTKLGISTLWTLDRFENKLLQMREIYQQCDRDASATEAEDVFLDHNDTWEKDTRMTTPRGLSPRVLHSLRRRVPSDLGQKMTFNSISTPSSTQTRSSVAGTSRSTLPSIDSWTNMSASEAEGMSVLELCRDQITANVHRFTGVAFRENTVDKVLGCCDTIRKTVRAVLEAYSAAGEQNETSREMFGEKLGVRVSGLEIAASQQTLLFLVSQWASLLKDGSAYIHELYDKLVSVIKKLSTQLVLFLQGCENDIESMVQESSAKLLDALYLSCRLCGELSIATGTPLVCLQDAPVDSLLTNFDEQPQLSVDTKHYITGGSDVFVDQTLSISLKAVQDCDARAQALSGNKNCNCLVSRDVMRQVEMLTRSSKSLLAKLQERQMELDNNARLSCDSRGENYFHRTYLRNQGLVTHITGLTGGVSLLLDSTDSQTLGEK